VTVPWSLTTTAPERIDTTMAWPMTTKRPYWPRWRPRRRLSTMPEYQRVRPPAMSCVLPESWSPSFRPAPMNTGAPSPSRRCAENFASPFTGPPAMRAIASCSTNEALLLRARNCDVHQGDWAVVLPVVVAFLAAIPAAAATLTIAHAARSDPRYDSLTPDDRRLALALLSYSDSLRIYTTVHGHREAIGRHRICAARTAGVTHLPVWYDRRSPRPPAAATLLQRG
jgi:hypothetical protein